MRKRYNYYAYCKSKPKKFIWKFPTKKPPAAASVSSDPPPPPWIELPRDLTANILQRLGTIEVLMTAMKVCTTWRSVCKDPAMWRVIDMAQCDSLSLNALQKLCRFAVDLSKGQVVDISIQGFCTDDLLLYIAPRANQLRCLKLVACNIHSKCLTRAARKFRLLQELKICDADISKECIKAVGHSCPLLTSFTYNKIRNVHRNAFDGQAIAVAENMHGLCHLALYGNNMTDKGVQAILDGCPHLKSLDLRRCVNVTFDGDLGKRCSKQIKDLKRPYDSNFDCGEFYDDEDDDSDDYSPYDIYSPPPQWFYDNFDDYDGNYHYDGYDGFNFDDFDYDDYTDPFNSVYFNDDYPDIPPAYWM